ncbi:MULTISPECIES: bifunctional diguanylate cyclase/phosphodiesterase [Vibrio]|uniref:Diguanylate cyclase n=2 Tax=Vibrio TaxID=662 RepID=A0A1E5CMZ3_9VIBR|nr:MULTISPECIES: EAL domain-containing protein [Vibrio]MDN3695754.1 EAL domain-containing protein [Vibrio cortegadensis]OEE71293.1 diguanylate cyclase [Vibrio genomosp. F6 str. FF-238]
MTRINTQELSIPENMQLGWQNIVDLLAEIISVPSALIMRVHPKHIEVFCRSNSPENPYLTGDSESLGKGLYCETVINSNSELLVPNALKDDKWKSNPDIALGMISYCGIPLNWPNGDAFGTICVLDSKENHYSPMYRELLESFRISIESQLTTLYQHAKLLCLNDELKYRVKTRTKDLASLNYSLNQEIDKRKAAEQQISYQKSHDSGTGFLNRNAFETELDKLMKNRVGNTSEIAVIHIGFTNGRRIQAKYGYHAFDEVLKRYRDRIGGIDLIETITARPTSIDLAIAIRANDISTHLELLCHKLIEVGHSEFFIENDKIHLHAFIGIATGKDGQIASDVLKHANEAMIACKDSGNKYRFFSQSLSDSQSHINQLESYLLQAVRNDDLMLYFQPKVCPTSHKWTGAEALLRWRHPVLGDISNETLIHMAEQNGLIFEVGNFVLRAAIEKAREWSDYVDHFKMAVNVSAIQLKNVHFADQVQHLLETYHLPPSYLELEVTESGLIADEAVARNTLQNLHDLGITLSLDDFGTGYASFAYLKKFPFDCIKIDKSFVQQIDKSVDDEEIVRSIVQIAKKLDLKVIIEGVETQEHENFIIDEGCDIGQGYFYGKPMTCQDFEQGLINQNYIGSTQFTYQ